MSDEKSNPVDVQRWTEETLERMYRTWHREQVVCGTASLSYYACKWLNEQQEELAATKAALAEAQQLSLSLGEHRCNLEQQRDSALARVAELEAELNRVKLH